MDLDLSPTKTLAGAYTKYLKGKGVQYATYHYVNASIIGGRVQMAQNMPSMTTEPVVPLDMKSMYPAATIQMGGFVKGTPVQCYSMAEIESCDFYVARLIPTDYDRNAKIHHRNKALYWCRMG